MADLPKTPPEWWITVMADAIRDAGRRDAYTSLHDSQALAAYEALRNAMEQSR